MALLTRPLTLTLGPNVTLNPTPNPNLLALT